jgi:hypothetical protein
MAVISATMLAFAIVWPQDSLFYLGLAAGALIALPFVVDSLAPEHVDRWRRGAEAEKRTARELRPLVTSGWTVVHDIAGRRRANHDHVAVAPSGEIFLLDSKAPGGVVTIAKGVLRVRWIEDPDDGYETDLTPRMKAAAAGLSQDLARGLAGRPWVTPVVVVWGRWDGDPHIHHGVAWVHGSIVADRLASNAGTPHPAKHAAVVAALRSRTTAGTSDASEDKGGGRAP